MAKNKLAKRNPLIPKKDLGVMKLSFDNHFLGHIKETLKFKIVVQAIHSKLMQKQLLLFKSDIFRHFMNLDNYPFSDVKIYNMLFRQVAHEETNEDQLWFQIGECLTYLLIGEWCLVMDFLVVKTLY